MSVDPPKVFCEPLELIAEDMLLPLLVLPLTLKLLVIISIINKLGMPIGIELYTF